MDFSGWKAKRLIAPILIVSISIVLSGCAAKLSARDAQEWNPWLAVPRQQKMLPKTWGEMKRVKQ